MAVRTITVLLSALISSRRNPRRVKPEREAHRKLVASLNAHGLIQPLVVRKAIEADRYEVIAGKRRLAALREVFKGKDPKVACMLRGDDEQTADAVSLAENFAREPMTPLDEADAFSALATADGKNPEAIAADFGVPTNYVRQRMKLSSLAPSVKAAYRDGGIDTSTAEAFAAVPEDRQEKVWEEVGGQPRHAQHVRNIIANGWIDAKHALFDTSTLPEAAVSRDLFGDQLLVERSSFMEAQSVALLKERDTLTEDGWANVVIGPRETVYSDMAAMQYAEREFDPKTSRKLEKLAERRAALEATEIEEGDDATAGKVGAKLDVLEQAEQAIVRDAPEFYAEATKAVGTAFLVVLPDGQVERKYRVPRTRPGRNGDVNGNGGDASGGERMIPPTSADLSDRQVSSVFTHHTLAVRESVLAHEKARKCVLALLLHEKVRSEALAVRPDANGVTLHATMTEGFSSPAFDRLAGKRAKLDPLADVPHVDDVAAYKAIKELSPSKLDGLIDLLVAQAITCHALRPTKLIHVLAAELKVDIRKSWRPDAAWLSSFRKAQLSHLLAELHGPIYDPAREKRKKTELVEVVATLFADAAEGKLEDTKLAERVNRWLPSCLRDEACANF